MNILKFIKYHIPIFHLKLIYLDKIKIEQPNTNSSGFLNQNSARFQMVNQDLCPLKQNFHDFLSNEPIEFLKKDSANLISTISILKKYIITTFTLTFIHSYYIV